MQPFPPLVLNPSHFLMLCTGIALHTLNDDLQFRNLVPQASVLFIEHLGLSEGLPFDVLQVLQNYLQLAIGNILFLVALMATFLTREGGFGVDSGWRSRTMLVPLGIADVEQGF